MGPDFLLTYLNISAGLCISEIRRFSVQSWVGLEELPHIWEHSLSESIAFCSL